MLCLLADLCFEIYKTYIFHPNLKTKMRKENEILTTTQCYFFKYTYFLFRKINYITFY